MKKTSALIRLGLAVVLCTIGLTTAVAADDVPNVPQAPRAGSYPQSFSMSEALIDRAAAIATAQKASNDPAVGAVGSHTPTPTPAPRAATAARSYPRSFYTYDTLIEYATVVATAQQAANDRLVALIVRDDAASAALAEVFDPRVRGGLLKARTDLMDDATLNLLRTQLANDAASARELKAAGATVAPAASWRLPLVGEDTQDFGPTPYRFEPALTYGGVFYPHFHSGTDIAAPWGTPIVAPAWGVVVFAGQMGDGAEVVVLAHDSGLVSMYAHLDNYVFPVPVKTGDTVEAGDRIGYVGLTGITTGMHLHWSVWRDGELIDPLSMIGS